MAITMSTFLLLGIVLTVIGTVGTGIVLYQRRLQWQEICQLAEEGERRSRYK
mgnify:CR=1 FL=1